MNSTDNNTSKPESLDQLITALAEGDQSTYNHIIHAIDLEAIDFKEYISWSEDCYTRNCIADTAAFELILICWCEGHQTAIHDHGGEECWVKVIEGEFKETIYKQNELGVLNLTKSSISKTSDITYMKDFMGFHRLENIAKKRSMSLHLYAKPIRNCNVFNEESKTFVNKALDYDTTI